jgi:hypothetical protein
MFLGELPLFLQKMTNGNHCSTELRLMGRVTHVSRQCLQSASSSCQANDVKSQLDKDVTLLVIDDGTSSVDVVSSSAHSLVVVGQLIDCIGHIYLVSDFESSSPSSRNYYIQAKSLTIVNNPQEEILRHLELSKNSNFENVQSTQFTTTLQQLPKNITLTTPHLERQLNNLHHSMHPFPSLTLNSDVALGYIRYSANHGGLSITELETLLGVAVNSEKRAVREAVEKLQGCGMVCLKEGRLYPL